MTEDEELKLLLFTMLDMKFKKQTTQIIENLQYIMDVLNNMILKCDMKPETDESILKAVSESIVFSILKRNL